MDRKIMGGPGGVGEKRRARAAAARRGRTANLVINEAVAIAISRARVAASGPQGKNKGSRRVERVRK